jgi:small subunit ribosomal protein S17
MAEEEKNEKQEETPEAAEETPAEETPAADAPAEDAPAEEAPADEPQAEEPAADEAPPEAEEPAAEESPADEPAAEAEEAESDSDAPEAGGDAPADEEVGDWKTRRRLERSRRPAEQRPQQTPEERAAARGEARKQAARGRSSYRAKSRTKRTAGTGTPPAERRSAGRKVRQGRVVSSKPDKTITVQIEVARRHPQYEKIVRRSRTLHAHDARNEAGEGDLVKVVETRPLSRTKRWRLIEILEKAQ